MAFLDNSGDIILDAVLTDTGRRRLSEGNFQIRKFALGDDEIQYNLYDKNNPSGSAYYDLEILQTPIEVAHTKASEIQYGLLTLTNNNLLYMPSLVLNELTTQSVLKYQKVLYLAVNVETRNKIVNTSNIDEKYVLMSNIRNPTRAVVIESGINTTDLKGTPANRTAYLQATNLLDSSYAVSVDSRFINGVWSTGPASTFSNSTDGTPNISFGPLVNAAGPQRSRGIINYQVYNANTVDDLVSYYASQGANLDTLISAVAGPRGTAAKLNFNVPEDLRDDAAGTRATEWTKYGQVAQNVFSTGQLYDIIDTFVLVAGSSTNASIQVPLRLIRYVSG
tara:strand:+ start:953 stop:1960 length:1008 start_codon:yes stop_codon:yes gene_type:complete